MRISDWSSDVCSSDLAVDDHDPHHLASTARSRHDPTVTSRAGNITLAYTDGACSGNPGPGGWAWAVPDGDRKSGVEGKGVAVRVELGGCRLIKKKKKQKTRVKEGDTTTIT